jgi:hypothetical protein
MSGSSDPELLSDDDYESNFNSPVKSPVKSDSGNQFSNGLPSLQWKRVEVATYPPLSQKYYEDMEQIERNKEMAKEVPISPVEKTPEGKGALIVHIEKLKQNFKEIWDNAQSFQPRREKDATTVVEQWPEPNFLNVTSNAEVVLPKVIRVMKEVEPMGGEFEEKQVLMRRWYNRSRFEAVYERQKTNLENEKDKRKRMMAKDGPFNSNMEALGSRVKTEQSRQPLSILPPRQSTHENVRPQNDRWSLDHKDKNRENMMRNTDRRGDSFRDDFRNKENVRSSTERSSRQSYEDSPNRQNRERMGHRQRSRSPISRDRHGSPRRSHANARMHAYGGRDERHSFSGGRRDNRF